MKYSKILKMQKIKNKILFFISFIKELGGFHIFLVKIFKVLFKNGFKEASAKTKYILKQAGLVNTTAVSVSEYQKWINEFDTLSDVDIAKMAALQKDFKIQPLISVIMPTWNSNPQWLKEAIESVRNQIYQNWELCIADDASTKQSHFKILHDCQKSDSRIKVVFRKENGHISEASNSAIEIANGDFLALFDHDDLLPPDALFRVADSINKNPQAAIIYSDEDKIDSNGKRLEPYFKCDWNYSLFLSQNLVSHLGVFRTNVIKTIGGFRKGFEGSQDYDLALRAIELVDDSQIVHIPRVLYQWRIHRDSTAKSSGTKPYAVLSARKAIQEHLQRIHAVATVEILPIQMYRVKFQLTKKKPFVSIIIPTKNNKQFLEKCINSLISKSCYPNFEVLIVDNGSDEPETLKYLEALSDNRKIIILKDARSFNFSAINNQAARQSEGEYLCFLNDDTEIISHDWLDEMMSQAIQPGVGAVGAKLFYPDDTLQHGGVILGIGGVCSHAHKGFPGYDPGYFSRAALVQEFSAVTGACMVVKKSIFLEAGLFDEVNLAVAFNDIDFCLRIRAEGYRILWTPYSELYHYESKSRGDDRTRENEARFRQEMSFMMNKWGNILKRDPAYSPNLTLEREDFSLAWPPRISKEF
jgi:O-antigen biosynthesis protein